MDCGVPFCHTGCPLGNIIPDFNDLVYRDRWQDALARLHATNNFPEFTGRVCPAPCETACVLGINEDPVSIKQIEMSIADRGFEEGWIVPEPPTTRTGKRVAVVGSGPAGLAAAQQLNRAGHLVTVFERADRPGGLLMYGIPDFKLEKSRVWRRVKQLEAEGVEFRCNANVGGNVETEQLRREYDAILLTGGSTAPRDLPIPGRNLPGVYFAMEFLPQQNKRNQGDTLPAETSIMATGQDVIIIGGGDTGSDCTGTQQPPRRPQRHAVRAAAQAARSRLLSPRQRAPGQHALALLDDDAADQQLAQGRLRSPLEHPHQGVPGGRKGTRQEPGHRARSSGIIDEQGRQQFKEIPGTTKVWPCQLVLLAMGFLGPEKRGAIADLNLELDPRGNVKCDANYMTSVSGVFAAGDMRRGQSLVVWAIHEGREAARAVDKHLMGASYLPSVNAGDFAWK